MTYLLLIHFSEKQRQSLHSDTIILKKAVAQSSTREFRRVGELPDRLLRPHA